jgi:hypothetical protein
LQGVLRTQSAATTVGLNIERTEPRGRWGRRLGPGYREARHHGGAD